MSRYRSVGVRRALHRAAVATAAAVVLVNASTAHAQQLIGAPVVHSVPGMAEVGVTANIVFKGEGGQTKHLDLYLPADEGAAVPVVVFVNAGGMEVRRWAAYTSGARLVAASGLAGVTYDALDQSNASDLADVVAFLRANARELGVDPDRIAIWASSRNVAVALPFLADAERDYLEAAVLYYGVTNPGITLRDDVAWLVARAGRDSPALNRGIDAQITAAIANNTDLTFFNYPDGQHAFDIRDDTDESRRIIAATVRFLVDRLSVDYTIDGVAR